MTDDAPSTPHPLRFAHADAERGPSVAGVAEIGVNHDGHAGRAAELIRAADDAGADAVKFQCFHPDRLLGQDAALAEYQQGQAESARALLEPLALSIDELSALRDAAQRAGLAFVVTPFSPEDVADLRSLRLDAVKTASPDAVNPVLMDEVAKLGVPLLASTGTCDLDELDHAARVVQRVGGALLHCVSAYPTPDDQAALGGVAALRERFGLPTGYSDHTASVHTGAWAVCAGACVLEKHLTHDRAAPGPDHAASLEPDQLREYISHARAAATAHGPIRKACTDVERGVRTVSRQSLAYRRDLPAGHVLTLDDLTTRRPGSGVPAAQRDAVVGRTLTQAVHVGEALSETHTNAT